MASVTKRTFLVGLVALATTMSAPELPAASNPGEIGMNFKGQVVDNTCTWNAWHGQNPDGSPVVDSQHEGAAFGMTALGNYTGLGAVGSVKMLRLKFTRCGQNVTTAKIRFEGPTTNSLHAVDATCLYASCDDNSPLAEGLGFQLWDSTGTIQLKSDDASEGGMLTVNLTPAQDGEAYDYYVDLQSRVVQVRDEQPTPGMAGALGTLTIHWQ